MIIHNRPLGRRANQRTVLPFAREVSTASQHRVPLDDGRSVIRATRGDGGDSELAAQTMTLKAIGERELANAETQSSGDSTGIANAVGAALLHHAEPFVRSRPDAAAAANAERRFKPILERFAARAEAMDEQMESLLPVLRAGESVIDALRSGVDNTDELMAGHADLIRDAPLTNEQKQAIADAMFARLKNEGLDHLIGARLDTEKTSAAVRRQGRSEEEQFPTADASRRRTGAQTERDAATENASSGPTAQTPDSTVVTNASLTETGAPPLEEHNPLEVPQFLPRIHALDEADAETLNFAAFALWRAAHGDAFRTSDPAQDRFARSIDPNQPREAVLRDHLPRFFSTGMDLSETEFRELAQVVKLDDELAVMIHRILNATEENEQSVRAEIGGRFGLSGQERFFRKQFENWLDIMVLGDGTNSSRRTRAENVSTTPVGERLLFETLRGDLRPTSSQAEDFLDALDTSPKGDSPGPSKRRRKPAARP